jgi:hypothetical protein
MIINIGEKIRQRAKELRIGPTEFAKMISSTKQNIYSIYSRKSLDTQLLTKISQALEFDFFRYYTTSDLNFINEKSPVEVAVKYKPGKFQSYGIDGKFQKELYSMLDVMNKRLDEVTKELHSLKKITYVLEEAAKKK